MALNQTFPATAESVPRIVAYVTEKLSTVKLNRKELLREQLRVEDVAAKLIEYSKEGSEIRVSVLSFVKRYRIRFVCPGEEISLAELQRDYNDLLGEDEDTNAFIRRLAVSILGENIRLQNRGHVNHCILLKQKEERSRLFVTVAALFLGALAGLVLKAFIPAPVARVISADIFGSVSKLFLSAMKMVVGPLVFFSISASIADFGDLKALGRIAVKVFGCYVCTSLIAILVGFSIYHLVPIGEPGLAALVTDSSAGAVAAGGTVSVSIKDTILGIVPTDSITPFLESNMLQIMFFAVLMGIAVSAVANEHTLFKDMILSANAVFGKITAIIVAFMPAAVFCSMAKMVMGIDLSGFTSVALWMLVCYLGYVCMLVVYGILILAAGLNPLKFFKGFLPASLTGFSLSSSAAAIPVSVKMCDERLGISKRLYSFSIPFGAQVNMDGSCITFMITSLFMAKIFGIAITPSVLFTLVVSILLLSIGAPGVPGAGMVCMSILLPQIGISADALNIILGLYSLTAMGQTLCNCTGDAAVTTVVAKFEKLIDLEKFNAN